MVTVFTFIFCVAFVEVQMKFCLVSPVVSVIFTVFPSNTLPCVNVVQEDGVICSFVY